MSYPISNLVSKIDFEAMNALQSWPTLLKTILMLLEKASSFMEGIGLRLGEHFQFEISRWIDYEVEDWSYMQIKVTLLEAGMKLMDERGIDKFMILETLTSMATQILPQEVRREIVIMVE
jgi:hypothetical protein